MAFRAMLPQTTLASSTMAHLRRGDTVTLAFALPPALTSRDAQVTLTAVTLDHPLPIWQFPPQSLTLPTYTLSTLPRFVYVLAVVCVLSGSAGVYARRRARALRRL